MSLTVTGFDLVHVDENEETAHKNSRHSYKHITWKFLHKVDTGILEICHQS